MVLSTIAGLLYIYIIFVLGPIYDLRDAIARFLAGKWNQSEIAITRFSPEVAFVTAFFTRALEILERYKGEFAAGRILRSEVEVAAEIQQHVLSRPHNVSIPSLDIVANSRSATEVGGDSYDIIERNGSYYIYLGDATGHGVASGFIMMMTNALISGFSRVIKSGSEILAATNEVLKPRVKSNMLMTLLLLRWDESDRTLHMTGAGHEYLLIYKAWEGKIYRIRSGGMALGMLKDISKSLKDMQIQFDPGDIAIMYSDGITEAHSGPTAASPLFGIERLCQTIEKVENKTAQSVFNAVTIALSRFMGYGYKQFDDITLIVIHYRERDENGEKKPLSIEAPQIIQEQFITEWKW